MTKDPGAPSDAASLHDWCTPFLERLAETSNVTRAAEKAGVEPSTAYRLRRENDRFASDWHDALLEGYEHLEMEVLQRLREGADQSDKHKFDNANALRLLSLHKQTIDKIRAQRSKRTEVDVLKEINRRIDRVRLREKRSSRGANAA